VPGSPALGFRSAAHDAGSTARLQRSAGNHAVQRTLAAPTAAPVVQCCAALTVGTEAVNLLGSP